jgi:hypothetical protein
MSTHDSDSSYEAHADEHAAFDPDALDPEEPHSPAWLPFLGLGLGLMALLWLVATQGAEGTDGAEGSGTSRAPVAEGPAGALA